MRIRALLNVPSALIALLALCAPAAAQPSLVVHTPGAGVFGEPGSVTQREPETPREGESVQVWIKVGPSFTYDNVALYYTTDGSSPSGSNGVGFGATAALRNVGPGPAITFVRNESNGSGNDDWWVATLPTSIRKFGQTIRYKVGAWDSGAPLTEVFAGGPAQVFEWTSLLAWPGAGSGSATPSAGYPPYHIFKEEAVAGNGNINTMLDANGSIYDVYHPSVGCVQGVGTKNEGYSEGPDTFPPLLPATSRGQMHMNHAVVGIRPTNPNDGSGTTYWLSNRTGTDFSGITQSYVGDTNVVRTAQTLSGGPGNIDIEQFDFAPELDAPGGADYPLTMGATPNKTIHLKRLRLTNTGATDAELNVYLYADWAINGGDNFDAAFTDPARGAMVAYDNTQRFTSSSGEYNPTTFGDYNKNVSVYQAWMLHAPDTDTLTQGYWADTSGDQDQGWIGLKLTVPAGQTREVDLTFVGGFDDFAGATGTYAFQMAGPLEWAADLDLADAQAETEQHWTDWLAQGATFDCPDPDFRDVYVRGLLATALHQDDTSGAIIAGMHNGAYPFVWPRDMCWAVITLARAGFLDDADRAMNFLRDTAFRDVENAGLRGFFKQKYTTNGYTVWGTPQVDETSCYPWALRFLYDVQGDLSLLESHYPTVFEACLFSSQDSVVDNRLRYEESVDLVYSMNLWEDSFDVFNYSNASVIRGLEDGAAIADLLDQNVCPGGPGTCNYHNDRTLFTNRANNIRAGLDARLAWNGENTDISQLGIVYPFAIYPADHPRAALIADRINGVATDTFGNNHPLVNFGGEWNDLINRYWADGYWNNPGSPNPNASPWFLTTMWYGAYYATRQDTSRGTADIDNHHHRVDLLLDLRGPIGFGAEQIAPSNSQLYPGTDFKLQTAWPNAWESMSFFVDSVMLFLGYEPDADANVLRIRPKLPTAWSSMDFGNLTLGANRLGVRVDRTPPALPFGSTYTHTITNTTGASVGFDTVLRIDNPDAGICAVTVNGLPHAYSLTDTGVRVQGALATGPGAQTVIGVTLGVSADFNNDGNLNDQDFFDFVNAYFDATPGNADFNNDGFDNDQDFFDFVNAYFAGCA